MNRRTMPVCWLFSGMLILCLTSCGISQGAPSDGAPAQSPKTTSPAVSAGASPAPGVSPSLEDTIQPDPEHPVTREDYELLIADYDTEYMAYNMADRFNRQLYLVLGPSNRFLPGLPDETIEGGANLTSDGLLSVHLTVDRPHDGGTVDGVLIDFFYDPASNAVSDLSVEAFTNEDGTVYTIDYTVENALEDGRLLSKVVGTFEEYIRLNDVE